MIFYHVSLTMSWKHVCVRTGTVCEEGVRKKWDNAAHPLHLSFSGFQHPGAEFWIVAVPAVLHVCSAIWGEALALGASEHGMIMREIFLQGCLLPFCYVWERTVSLLFAYSAWGYLEQDDSVR